MRKKFILLFLLLFFAMIVCSAASATEIISKNSTGKIGNDGSGGGSMSADGRYVVFSSTATNLVPGDTNNLNDVFLRDRVTNTTTRVSLRADGKQIITGTGSDFPVISANGRYVAYATDGDLGWENNGFRQVYVYDRIGKSTRIISTNGNGESNLPSISADGSCIAFESYATNLIPIDNNRMCDIFVYSGSGITRVNLNDDDREAIGGSSNNPSISADGRYVAFSSFAYNLVPGDLGSHNIFVRDTLSGTIKRIMGNASGTPVAPSSFMYWPKISGNGRYVTFYSSATNLDSRDTNTRYDVYIADMSQPIAYAKLVSVSMTNLAGNGQSYVPSISYDGRYVAFVSGATDLVPGDTNIEDVFVRDMVTGEIKLISASSSGTPGNSYSNYVYLCADGKYVLFTSDASNLVSGDTNGKGDVFINAVNFSPTIKISDPANNAVNVPQNKVITITFNEPVKAGNMWIELKASNGTLIPIYRIINGNSLTIKHSALLTESKYTLILHTGCITDYAGNPVAYWSSKFSVGKSPIITSSNPANNAVNVARNKVITITFNEPVKAGNMWIELKASNGTLIPIYRIINGNSLTIKHSALLAPRTKYTIIFHTSSLTDNAGNLVAFSTRSFTTGST